MIQILIIGGVVLLGVLLLGIILTRLYKRSTKEVSFVRTGFGGEKVIMDGGALVLPVLHEVIPVNMNTLRLEVKRAADQALITKDRMRVDVTAEFYVRVKPDAKAIATAAQTLGKKTTNPKELKELIEGKFVDVLRSVASEMGMEELHEKRVDFVQKVQQVVAEDLSKNGLELETVSLTGLDQTSVDFFNPNNAFDAEGLTKLTETIEDRRKKRNEIEQDTDLAIRSKNLTTEQARMQIVREEEYAKLQQEREISIRKAEQSAEISAQEAAKKRESDEAQIAAEREVELKRIASARDIENENIKKSQSIEQSKIEQDKVVELANVEKIRTIAQSRVEQEKAIQLAEQDKAIAIAEKSRMESEAKAEADRARAEAVKAEEEVITVRETQRAERQKAVELVAAKQVAEKDAIKITVAAEADKKASNDRAEAITVAAQAEAESIRIAAQAQADKQALGITVVAKAENDAAEARANAKLVEAKAESESIILLANAQEKQYQVDAEGKEKLNAAQNILSADQINLQIRLALLQNLPEIIRESVKPMENIDSIKIVQLNGQAGTVVGSDGTVVADGSTGSLSDQVVNSALRYRSQAPLVDSLMNELGLKGNDINGLTQPLNDTVN